MIVHNAFICCNLCEPLSYASLRGYRYFIIFIDEMSQKTWGYSMKEKKSIFPEVLSIFVKSHKFIYFWDDDKQCVKPPN